MRGPIGGLRLQVQVADQSCAFDQASGHRERPPQLRECVGRQRSIRRPGPAPATLGRPERTARRTVQCRPSASVNMMPTSHLGSSRLFLAPTNIVRYLGRLLAGRNYHDRLGRGLTLFCLPAGTQAGGKTRCDAERDHHVGHRQIRGVSDYRAPVRPRRRTATRSRL
jgi:hypothetical protein